MNPGDPLDPFNQMMHPMNPLSPLYPHVMGGQSARPVPGGQALALLVAGFAVALGLLLAGVLIFVR